jgi:hypothetical protein
MKQRKSNKYKRIWVSPEFASKLKAESAINGCSVFDYSKELAQSQNNVHTLFEKQDRSLKKGFKFEI